MSSNAKHCVKCGQTKTADSFYVDKAKKSGLSSYCKICRNTYRSKQYRRNAKPEKEYYQQYFAKNPDKAKTYGLKTYGLTLAQFNDMRVDQNFSCKICKTHENNLKRKLFVDHCHATGKVRGLLCQSCNTMIGNAKDSVLVLQAGINYLAGV